MSGNRTLALTLALTSFGVAGLEAQDGRETGFMVHQLSVCQDMAEINRIDDVAAPILEQLRQEGMIRIWYQVRHGWGDEWNSGLITVADSHREWLDFWDEFVRRLNEAEPGAIGIINRLCTLHKDNMYGVRNSRSGGDS